MSSLAWIDFDEAERQRAQRIMALFQERETRDELGLGSIRDSIADHLFPGTSTIQTVGQIPSRADTRSNAGRAASPACREEREIAESNAPRSAIDAGQQC